MAHIDQDQEGLLLEHELPYMTADLPGIGGIIRARPSDFFVEELPLYQACGDGTHVYMYIEKRGISTVETISRIAKALGRKRIEIGFAGMKDAKAIARQWLSLEHVDIEALLGLRIPQLEILQVTRHTNKIRLGHLRANRFRIRIRQFSVPLPQAIKMTQSILEVLMDRGAPNYFGPQRFGNRRDGHLLGMALLSGQLEQFLDMYLGMPLEDEYQN
ncbi:MAG: tRNA pseudouridine(13) synthase TruD, partial [Sedimentisphaerales bacterium]|nr:tRNA pseudouridine(13) synthase TruD [Sedimentisphaerales bacterium]